jgi:hypothetical protein
MRHGMHESEGEDDNDTEDETYRNWLPLTILILRCVHLFECCNVMQPF